MGVARCDPGQMGGRDNVAEDDSPHVGGRQLPVKAGREHQLCVGAGASLATIVPAPLPGSTCTAQLRGHVGRARDQGGSTLGSTCLKDGTAVVVHESIDCACIQPSSVLCTAARRVRPWHLRWMMMASWNRATALVRVSVGSLTLRPLESSSRSKPIACTAHERTSIRHTVRQGGSVTAFSAAKHGGTAGYGHAGSCVQWADISRAIPSGVCIRAFHVAARDLSHSRDA